MTKKKKYQGGGMTQDPTKKNSTFSVNNIYAYPATIDEIYPRLAKAGLMGSGQDSTTLDQWRKMPPGQQVGIVKKDPSKFDYTYGNTANPGGVKFWSKEEVNEFYPAGFTQNYWDEKKKSMKRLKKTPAYQEIENYSFGGNVLEGASTGLSTFASLAPLAGTGVGLPIAAALGIGSFLLGQAKDKREKEEFDTQKSGAIEGANASWGMRNLPNGGLIPGGTPVEVEGKEVMRGLDGSLVKFSGPTHAQGGIDIEAQPGSQIFGKLKVKSGKYKGLKYREAADKIKKEISRLEKTIK